MLTRPSSRPRPRARSVRVSQEQIRAPVSDAAGAGAQVPNLAGDLAKRLALSRRGDRKSRTPPARSTPGSPCCVCPARRDAWLACAKPRPRKQHVAREHTTPHKKIDHHHQRRGPPGRHNCPEASGGARAHAETQRRSSAAAVKTAWPAKALCYFWEEKKKYVAALVFCCC